MFESSDTPTIFGLAAGEWEALSYGIDAALDHEVDYATALLKLEGVNSDVAKNVRAEMHYYRFGFSCTRYAQENWACITGIVGSVAALLFEKFYLHLLG